MLFFTETTGFPSYFGDGAGELPGTLASMNQHYADIAASIQKVTEEVLVSDGEASAQDHRPEATCAWPAAWR